jgi:adenosylcobinamide kinase/adenosylcobinamide-phosphate guanylyltransferase
MNQVGIYLILGGASSGKSEYAELLVSKLAGNNQVYYIAPALITNDKLWEERIIKHKNRRPKSWKTLEVKKDELIKALKEVQDTVIIDSLGSWLASYSNFEADIKGLIEALSLRTSHSVIVSDEVGLGVHPSYPSGMLFREKLGFLNMEVSKIAKKTWLIVAGRLLELGKFVAK